MGADIAELKEKINPIAQQYGVKSVYLFGSRARGDATAESDYDFFIEKGKIRGLKLFSFESALEKVLDHNIDIVTSGIDNQQLLGEINKDKVLIYEE